MSKAKVKAPRKKSGAKYLRLLTRIRPRPINSKREYQRLLKELDALMTPYPDAADGRMIELLSVLIENYESAKYPVPDVPPGRMLAHMIEARELTQAEVAAATGIPASTISAVIAGRRNLSAEAIARLCGYFNVSSDVFIRRQALAT